MIKQPPRPHSPPPRVPGFDRSGHMNAKRAKRLLDAGRQHRPREEVAFASGTLSNDELAEELAESAVASMNSGEDELRKSLDRETTEERGGPFVSSTQTIELGDDPAQARARRGMRARRARLAPKTPR